MSRAERPGQRSCRTVTGSVVQAHHPAVQAYHPAVPAQDRVVLAQDRVVLAQDRVVPAQDCVVPAQDCALPAQDRVVPDDLPADRSRFPRSGRGSRVPEHGTADPAQGSLDREQILLAPLRCDEKSDAGPRRNARGSAVPESGAAVPEQVPAFRQRILRSGRGSGGRRPRSAGNDDLLASRGREPGQDDRPNAQRSAGTGHPLGEPACASAGSSVAAAGTEVAAAGTEVAAAVPRSRVPDRGKRCSSRVPYAGTREAMSFRGSAIRGFASRFASARSRSRSASFLGYPVASPARRAFAWMASRTYTASPARTLS
jgi:hypothetical protein